MEGFDENRTDSLSGSEYLCEKYISNEVPPVFGICIRRIFTESVLKYGI
jgi:hypothetical protein